MRNNIAIKMSVLLCFYMVLAGRPVFADQVEKIRSLYTDVNKIIERGAAKETYFQLGSKGWEKSARTSAKSNSDSDLTESAKVYMINRKLLKTTMLVTSPSGDWVSTSDYYFYENGKTAFIFESYLTYQGYDFDKGEDLPPGPYIIEKRLYFNENGQEVKSLTKSFIKSSKKEIPIKYLKKNQFDIYSDTKSLPFYNLLF